MRRDGPGAEEAPSSMGRPSGDPRESTPLAGNAPLRTKYPRAHGPVVPAWVELKRRPPRIRAGELGPPTRGMRSNQLV